MMKVAVINEREFDSFNSTFDCVDDFLSFLREREQNTERHELPAKEVRFMTIEQGLRYYKTEQNLANRLGVSVELLEETKSNTDILVVFRRNAYLLGSSAWVSLKNRMNIYGSGYDQLSAELQTAVLNYRFAQIGDKTVKVIIVDKKVRAIMSDEYAVVPTAELFEAVLERTASRFGGYELVASYADHNIARCKIIIPAVKDTLNQIYNLPDEYIPGIIIETSDTGFSANKIGPYWQVGKASFINAKEYIYMPHIGKINLNTVLDELPNVFLKYQNTLKKFAALMQIELSMPVKVLKKACKKIELPRKLTRQLVEQFELNLSTRGGAIVTAYDVCREILFAPQLVDGQQKTIIEEKVGKAINLNYVALDEEDDDN